VQTASLTADDLKKSALLVMIHGSPNESANQPMLDVLEMIRQREIFGFIQPGFMECNSPDIPSAVDICAEKSVKRIIAVPYFLHLGTHVADDLPTLLLAGQAKHPPIEILMTDYLGRSEKLSDVLLDRAVILNQ
jgi:sirohydrochlorin ferrochelatase